MTTVLDAPPAPIPASPAPSRRPGWERPALAALLVGTAVLYLWNLSASGTGNDFYAAAVQAGTKSWKAFFFGSFDSSNFITVDKPPASLWVMELSGRIFGFNSWSMLAPQALEGVASVALLYAAIRRWFGPAAALLAGALFALTPVAVLMFRFNNPDALMTLLIVAAAYCVIRALESAPSRSWLNPWLLLAGVAIGFSFLTKGLQPFTVVPALGLVYLVGAPAGLGRRLGHLLGAAVAILVAAGWWVLAVQLTPAADRPYIGGSTNNNVLGLAFGYNGIGRITGNGGGGPSGRGPVGGGGGGPSFSGSTGLGRLFNSLNGSQIAWLLPAALVAIVALVLLARRAGRTDRLRLSAVLWGGWLVVTGLVLSFASGVIHTYYTVELAPAIAALVGVAIVSLWRARADVNARLTLATGVIVTAAWSYLLLGRAPGWNGWLTYVVVIAAVVCAAALVTGGRLLARTGIVALSTGLIAIGGGSAAYALDTAHTPHTGSTPTAGPAASGGFGGAAGFGGGGSGGGRLGGFGPGFGAGGGPRFGDGGFGGGGFRPGTEAGPGRTSGGGGGGPTGGGGQAASSALVTLLKATDTTWAAATIGSQSAAPLELQSGKAVMAIGGFTGSDPSITLAQFEKLVDAGKIRYFIGGGGRPGGSGSDTSAISSWVASHFSSSTVGGTTVYDLTKATS